MLGPALLFGLIMQVKKDRANAAAEKRSSGNMGAYPMFLKGFR